VEPVEHALHNAKTLVEGIIKALKISDMDVTLYLSGGKNFRYDIAKTRPYKGNRDDSQRPTHEEAIRTYLKSKWNTVVTDGIEADDALGIAMSKYGADGVICSVDKDLDMIPGKHYNFVEDIEYEVDEELAWRTFCKQLLTGDSTDNIPGLKGIGGAKAEKMLEGFTRDEWFPEVVANYARRSGRTDWFEYLREQAKLIWIMRHPTDPEVDMMLEGMDAYGGEVDETVQTDLFG